MVTKSSCSMDTIMVLKHNELFRHLSDEQLERLSLSACERSEPKLTVVFNEGDHHSYSMFLIKKGKVDVSVRNEEDREMILLTLEQGDHFGELSLFDGRPRSATIKTREDSEFIILGRPLIFQLLQEDPQFAMDVINYLCRKIRFITNIAQDLALLDSYRRLRKFLYQLARPLDNGMLQTTLPLDQADIASRVGCSREMTNKLLNELQAGGYITYTKASITLNHKLPIAR